MKRRVLPGIVLGLLSLTGLQGAVDPKLHESLLRDHQALTHYSWTTTFEFYREGKAEGSVVETMGFGADGLAHRAIVEDHRTSISREKLHWKNLENLTGTALPYLLPNLESFGRFLDDAQAKEESGRTELRDLGYIDPVDIVTVSVDPETLRAVSLSVEAPFHDGPMRIQADYDAIPDGPNHPSRITVTSGEWRIVMNNSDYRKSD